METTYYKFRHFAPEKVVISKQEMGIFLVNKRSSFPFLGDSRLFSFFLLFLFLFSFKISYSQVSGVDTYSSTGLYTWTAPAGITSVTVEVWGGGGGGGGGSNGILGLLGGAGGGGGGGAYVKSTLTVIPGNSYAIGVGGGGGGGGASKNGTAGNDSYFNSPGILKAVGGSAGAGGGSGGGGNGGAAGSSIGSTKYSGGKGASGGVGLVGLGSFGGGGGSSAGTAANGGNGSNGTGGSCGTCSSGGNSNGNSGASPGAGGAGRYAGNGGNGGKGQVKITYSLAGILTIGSNAIGAANVCPSTTTHPFHSFTITGSNSPANITQIQVQTSGNYTSAMVANMKLWTTGTSSTFSGATQLGSTIVTPGTAGTKTFSGLTYSVGDATHYFWVTVDITASASSPSGRKINGATTTTSHITSTNSESGSGSSSGTQTLGVGSTPSTPSTNAASDVACITFTANWNSTSKTTGYFLDVDDNSDFSSPLAGFNNLDVGNVLTYPVTGLTTGGTYYYRVRSDNCGSQSSSSSARTVNLSAVPATPGAITATPACSPARYTLTIADGSGANTWYWQGTNPSGTSTSLNATSAYNVTANGTYYVRSVTPGGCWSAGSGSTVLLTVGEVAGGTIASNQSICGLSDPDAFTSTDDGTGSSFEWQEDDNISFSSPTVVGGNSNVYDPPVLVGGSTYFRRKRTQGSCSEYSNTLFIEVAPAPPIGAGLDVAICKGSSTNLLATGGLAGYYLWVAPTGLSDDEIANPVANPSSTTTYTVTGYAIGTEKVQNPGFELGPSGFTSDYGYVSGGGCILCPEGVYTIGNNAQTTHPAFRGLPRTGGQQMIINGSGTPGANVWCQDFIVAPNNDYAFSTWVSTLHPGDGTINGRAKLQFSINGFAIGDPFYSPPMPSYPTPSGWDQFFAVWNSGSSSNATICVVNQNVTLGGNDFAFDDMSFAPFCGASDEVIVYVPEPILNTTLNPAAICSGGTFNYTPDSDYPDPTYRWTRAVVPGISNGAGSSGGYGTGEISETLINTTGSPINVTYRYRTRSTGCTGVFQNVVVTVNPAASLSSTLTPAAICSGDAFGYQATSTIGGATFAWSRAAVTGITEGASSGTGNVDPAETLTNTTGVPINVTYAYTTTAAGCAGSSQNVVVSVKPSPTLSSSLTPPDVCSGVAIGYTATSATASASFSWSRAAILGITEGQATGSGNITETLNNTSENAIDVTYVYTTSKNGCSSVENVVITIKALPQLSTSLSSAICSPNTFAYTPNSAVIGATFSWTRAAIVDINGNVGGAGTYAISEALANTSTAAIDVTYVYTSSYDGCSGAPQNLVVTVNPIPILSSAAPADICGGTTFAYTPTSATADATFTWTRAAVAGITQAASSGSEDISETLTNSTTATVPVTYKYITTAAGCSSTAEDVIVNVDPLPIIDSNPAPAAICSGTGFTYNPTTATGGGPTFNWSRAAVAGITEAANTGTGDPGETLTNTTSAAIDVTYVYTVTESGCTGASSNVVVRVNPLPQGEFFGNTVCFAAGDPTKLTFSATAGTGPFSLNYNSPGPVAQNEPAAVSNTAFTSSPDQGGSAAGDYTYVLTSITDANTCVRNADITTETATITVTNSVIVADPSTPASSTTCAGVTSTFFVDASGVQAYAWEVNVSGAGGGSYDVTAAWVAVGTEADPPSYNGSTSNTLVVENATTAHDGYRYRSVMTPACGASVTSTVARLTVNVLPVLTSSLAPTPATCSGTVFTYTPTSGTADATFTWTRAAVPGITELANSGAGVINETLNNTTVNAINVTYVYTTTSPSTTCSTLIENVVATINPSPILSSSKGAVQSSCSPVTFSYNAYSGTTGSTFAWERATIAGISEAGTTGTGNINPAETLTNTTTSPIDVTYVYTSTANTCDGPPENVVVTVNPAPVLSSTTNPPSICTAVGNFSYEVTSATPGTSYSWTRATMAGISQVGTSGVGDISETLTNTSTSYKDVVYEFTLSAAGCTGASQNVTVKVYPVPQLSSALSTSVCSGDPFDYDVQSATSGATFAWTRAAVASISPTDNTGTSDISETLTNNSTSSVNTTYIYTTTANGCVGPGQSVVVAVHPVPLLTSPTSPPSICSDAVVTFDYTAESDVAGTTFAWSRSTVGGITQPASSGSGNVSEVLTSTSTSPITVRYVYTPTYSGCSGDDYNVDVIVNPIPIISSNGTDSICSGVANNYNTLSATTGVSFTWSRDAVASISEGAATGTGDITETLTNTSAFPVEVDYLFIATADGCSSPSPETIVITVNPAPTITSTAEATICTGTSLETNNTLTFTADVTSTFSWERANTVDIGPPGTTSGVSNPIDEELTNVTDDPITTTYVVTPTSDPYGACEGTPQNVDVSVTPVPIQPNGINGNPN